MACFFKVHKNSRSNGAHWFVFHLFLTFLTTVSEISVLRSKCQWDLLNTVFHEPMLDTVLQFLVSKFHVVINSLP